MNKKKGEVTKFTQFIRNAKKHWRRIEIKDKSLIFIMVILLGQCAYNLFKPGVGGADSAHIDIVIRTTTAAIFGYLISANFLRHFNDQEDQIIDKVCTCTTTSHKLSKEEKLEKQEEKKEEESYAKVQVIIVTCIGVFALIILIIARNVIQDMTITSASLSQFRDFVSGCVGFLMGIQDEKKNK